MGHNLKSTDMFFKEEVPKILKKHNIDLNNYIIKKESSSSVEIYYRETNTKKFRVQMNMDNYTFVYLKNGYFHHEYLPAFYKYDTEFNLIDTANYLNGVCLNDEDFKKHLFTKKMELI
jgi:hypothetical protein